MKPKFVPQEIEGPLSDFWEKNTLARAGKGKPYTILMPPPNANASLHAGHGMYVIDDIVTRYKRLRGYASIWIPGTDHAGFETQYVYEKHLKKMGKSRMDFDRNTLYTDIFAFVNENAGLIFDQFKRLGFLADWERSVFTLDDHVIDRVYKTFSAMEKDGIIYRDNYMVNYCTHCGTSLAELEVVHIERTDPLYYLKYGPFVLATVRPETKFGDTAVAVHPDDTRYKDWVGKTITIEGLNGSFTLNVIADSFVDPQFGTGVVKITPCHDPQDFEVGKRHNLEMKQAIDWNGRMTELTGKYTGMKVNAARKAVVADLQARGLIDHIDSEYTHAVSVCYKCKRDLEPMVTPNWFVRVDTLKKKVKTAVKNNTVRFTPRKMKTRMLQWLDIMHDWPISRQIVWGIRIPVWYAVDRSKENLWAWWIDSQNTLQFGSVKSFLDKGVSLTEIHNGLQKINAATGDNEPDRIIAKDKPQGDYLPETDTFDTWFSSGQWPLVTLRDDEVASRFPTDFMGTSADILKFWISRMILFSLYITDTVPFKDVYLWSMVVDSKGQKMSKSKGNVINPIDLINEFGADAFRASLIFGTSQSGRIPLARERVIGMRNFTNKIWNIGRFIWMMKTDSTQSAHEKSQKISPETASYLTELNREYETIKKTYLEDMDTFHFARAFDMVYEFLWHRYADFYIEQLKEPMKNGNIEVQKTMEDVLFGTLQMIHPFMPFVTDALWRVFHGDDTSILKTTL